MGSAGKAASGLPDMQLPVHQVPSVLRRNSHEPSLRCPRATEELSEERRPRGMPENVHRLRLESGLLTTAVAAV